MQLKQMLLCTVLSLFHFAALHAGKNSNIEKHKDAAEKAVQSYEQRYKQLETQLKAQRNQHTSAHLDQVLESISDLIENYARISLQGRMYDGEILDSEETVEIAQMIRKNAPETPRAQFLEQYSMQTHIPKEHHSEEIENLMDQCADLAYSCYQSFLANLDFQIKAL